MDAPLWLQYKGNKKKAKVNAYACTFNVIQWHLLLNVLSLYTSWYSDGCYCIMPQHQAQVHKILPINPKNPSFQALWINILKIKESIWSRSRYFTLHLPTCHRLTIIPNALKSCSNRFCQIFRSFPCLLSWNISLGLVKKKIIQNKNRFAWCFSISFGFPPSGKCFTLSDFDCCCYAFMYSSSPKDVSGADNLPLFMFIMKWLSLQDACAWELYQCSACWLGLAVFVLSGQTSR